MPKKNGRPLYVPKREPVGYIDSSVYCTERGELCAGCPYPRHGFICWFHDGSCLRTEMSRLAAREGASCRA